MATRKLENITFIRNSTALGGIEKITGGVNSVATNYTTTVNDFIIVATALSLTITIDAVTQNEGQWLHIKDGTGKASIKTPLTIVTSGFSFDSQTKMYITSPYGGISVFIDTTANEIFSMPWNPVLDGTLETIVYKDQDALSPPVTNVNLVTLPQGSVSPNEISIQMVQATMIPFITADTAASTATMTFSHRFFDGTNQVLTVPNGNNLTVTNGTNTYFTGDGTLDATQNYAAANAFGELRVDVLGDAVNSTPRQQVVIDFDSRGLEGSGPELNCRISYRSAQFLDLT